MPRWKRSAVARARRASSAPELRDSVKLSGKTDFSGYDRLADRAGRDVADIRRRRGRCVAARPRRPGRAGPHAVLCGKRRPDRRCRRAVGRQAARFTVRDTQKIGASFAHVGVLDERRAAGGRCGRGAGRPRAPQGDCAQSFGDASCCMRPCERCWASTSSKRARWSPPIGCASIFRTLRR